MFTFEVINEKPKIYTFVIKYGEREMLTSAETFLYYEDAYNRGRWLTEMLNAGKDQFPALRILAR